MPEYIADHNHDGCGVFECCVNEIWLDRCETCIYGSIEDKQLLCAQEEVDELANGDALCNECWHWADTSHKSLSRAPIIE